MTGHDLRGEAEGLLAATSRRNALRGLAAGSIAGSAIALAGRSARAQNALTSAATEATVRVSKHLDANVTEAGSIAYIGDPQVSKDVSIAGKLTEVG